MPSRLISQNFAIEFEGRLVCAEMVRIASAWMTESDALQALLECDECKVQALVGIRGNATSPSSLLSLAREFGWESIKIANDRSGLFHPKLYLFSYSTGRTVAWIGSANFTGNGMAVNTELVLETDDESAVGAMVEWFDMQWTELNQNTEEEFAAYKMQWQEPHWSAGDRGGMPDQSHGAQEQIRSEARVRVDPARRHKHQRLRGVIEYGPGDVQPYTSAADGLRQLLVWLSHGRANEFLEACRSTAAFQRPNHYYIARGRSKREAISRGRLYYPKKGVTCLLAPEGSHWKWWMSENSNSQAKWEMAKAAFDVANERFGDEVRLDAEDQSWPDQLV